jgi:hypothetical protein
MSRPTISSLNNQIAELKGALASMQIELDSRNETVKNLRDFNEHLESQEELLRAEIERLQTRIAGFAGTQLTLEVEPIQFAILAPNTRGNRYISVNSQDKQRLAASGAWFRTELGRDNVYLDHIDNGYYRVKYSQPAMAMITRCVEQGKMIQVEADTLIQAA